MQEKQIEKLTDIIKNDLQDLLKNYEAIITPISTKEEIENGYSVYGVSLPEIPVFMIESCMIKSLKKYQMEVLKEMVNEHEK